MKQLFILFLLSAFLPACSLFSSDDEFEPAALVDFEERVELDRSWSRRLGDQGDEELYLRLLPVIDGDNIFAANADGKVFAFDRIENDRLWKVDVDASLMSAVGAGENLVLVASADGLLFALSQENGEERWRAPLSSEMLAAAQVADGVVLAQTMDGKVSGLDAATGNLLWTYATPVPALSLRSSATPLLEAGVAYVAFSNGKLIALNVQTGLLLWQKQVSFPSGRNELERIINFDGKPLVSGSDLYVASYQGNAASLNKQQGQMLWSEKVSARGQMASGNGNLYLTQSDDSVLALKLATGRHLWENSQLSYRGVTAPAFIESDDVEAVVVADAEGYLHLLDTETGEFIGRYNLWRDTVRNAPLSDGSTLYLLTDKGKLRAFELESSL